MLHAITDSASVLENIRIREVTSVLTPAEVKQRFPLTATAAKTVQQGRQEIEAIISSRDDRLLVIVGPCSIHDKAAAYEYAERLARLRREYSDKLCIVMRVYFEKPRTTVGWKGLLAEPDLVGKTDFDKGRLLAREILLHINELGVPAATEILNPTTPQVISDLVAWGAIGARTTESQSHREIASGLSFPVGIKNGTGGSVMIAINAMLAAREPHTFLGIDSDSGTQCCFTSTGNPYTQLILRGGNNGPNYTGADVAAAVQQLRQHNLSSRAIVDCSHANAEGDYLRQAEVLRYVISHRKDVDYPVYGVMIESNLVAGKQACTDPQTLTYGKSITDACVGWEETEKMLANTYSTV